MSQNLAQMSFGKFLEKALNISKNSLKFLKHILNISKILNKYKMEFLNLDPTKMNHTEITSFKMLKFGKVTNLSYFNTT